jgi:hypothetical protein
MFKFTHAEKGRIRTGEFASKPHAPTGSFIIPLSNDAPRIIVQAQTKIIADWEILEAEQVIREPNPDYNENLNGKDKEYRWRAMPPGLLLVEDLKRWFWDKNDVVFIIFPAEKEDVIEVNVRPLMMRLVHPIFSSEIESRIPDWLK